MDSVGGRGGRAGSPHADEPPAKRQAMEEYIIPVQSLPFGPEARAKLKDVLMTRKRRLEDEMRFLNNAGGLLDFAGSLSKTGTGCGSDP